MNGRRVPAAEAQQAFPSPDPAKDTPARSGARRAVRAPAVPLELTPEQLEALRQELLARRGALVTTIEEHRLEERDTRREVGDEMDDANLEGNAALVSKLIDRDVHLLREIDRALTKMDEGQYGLCEGTGEPIGYERLRLAPWARYSVAYQEEIERAARDRGL